MHPNLQGEHLEDGGGFSLRNFRQFAHLDASVCPPQHFIAFSPRDIFKPFHIVEFIKVLLRAVCQNAPFRDPDEALITHFMWSGVDVCWQRFAPATELPRRYTKGRVRARKVLWLSIFNFHNCFTCCFC